MRIWSSRKSLLLVGCKMVQPRWKRGWQFLKKLTILLPYNPGIVLLDIQWKEVKTYVHNKACSCLSFSVQSVQSLSHVLLSVTPWTAALQASLSITNSQSLSNSCPWSWWCHPTISPSVFPFSSCLQSFPASGSFQMTQFFTSGGQSIGISASTSVLPMNIQDWSPLGLTGWISLQSKGLSRVFSNTTVQKHQFFGTQLS